MSAISVDPRPTASPTGRQVCQVVGPAVRQLDWGMKVVKGDRGVRIDVLPRHRHPGRHDIGIATYRTTTTVLYDVGIATYRYGAIPISRQQSLG